VILSPPVLFVTCSNVCFGYSVTRVVFISRILNECGVQLYRQMGGVRDDLNIHEKALDILIELLKKEQVSPKYMYVHVYIIPSHVLL